MDHRRRTRYLTQPFLPRETVKVGRWVPHVGRPHHGYLDPSIEDPPVIHTSHQLQFTQLYERNDGTGIKLEGTVLAYGSGFKQDRDTKMVSSESSTIYQMDDPDGYFRRAIKHSANRGWIENALKKHGKLYMIIGYQTVLDPAFKSQGMAAKEFTTGVQAPVGAALTGATGIPVLTDALDPSAEVTVHKSQGSQQSFITKGEQIVAIQYRRIRFKFFSSRTLTEENLETDSRWKYTWDMRGKNPDAKDVIEADLAYEDMADEEPLEEDDEEDDSDEMID